MLARMTIMDRHQHTAPTGSAAKCAVCGHDDQARPAFAKLRAALGFSVSRSCAADYELEDGQTIASEDCGCANAFHTLP